jgi:hypothetical protein
MNTIYDQILALINNQNENTVPFSLSNISFSDPIADSTTDHNTKITVESVAGAGYLGSVDLFYNRISLQQIGSFIWLFSDEPFTPDSVLSILNDSRNAFLVSTDVEQLNIPDMTVGDIVVMPIVTKPTSVNYNGESTLSLFTGFPIIANSLDNVMNSILPSANYLA